jgi:hypothetical protein
MSIDNGNGVVFVSEPLPQVRPFDERGARLHTIKTARSLVTAYDNVMEAYDRQAWVALYYDSWGDYLRAEFGGLRVVRVDDEQAGHLIATCREQGESYAQIAKLLGKSNAYVHKHDPTQGTEGTTTGADGKTYPKTTGRKLRAVPDVAPESPAEATEAAPMGGDTPDTATGRHRLIERVVAYVREHPGCTSADVKADIPVGHQRITPALSRAVASKRLRYEAPEKRGQFGKFWADDNEEGEK